MRIIPFLLMPFSAIAQDWGRHDKSTFVPHVEIKQPDTRALSFDIQTRIPLSKFTFETTAKDIGGKLYTPQDMTAPIWARTPPNIGEGKKP